MVNKEEILRLAKQNYPVGTIFKSAYNPEEYPKCEIKEESYFNFESSNLFNDDNAIYYYEKNKLGNHHTWAEIISLPFKTYELW